MLTDNSIRILLVEDSPVHAELIGSALSACSRKVELTIAGTLAEGRVNFAEGSPDLAIVDLILPDGRGTDLLPPEGESTSIPVLIMTSQGDEWEAVKAMRSGALDYLVKSSATLAEMPRIIERALREWEQIRQRREAEENLRRSEQNYRLLFENMTSGFALHEMIYDEQGLPIDYRFLRVNPAFESLTGLPASSVIGKRGREVLPNLEQGLIDVFGKVARTGEPIDYVNHSGELGKFYDIRAFSPGKDRFAVVFSDITDNIKSAEALKQSEERWHSVFTTAAAGMVIISPDRKLLQVNPYFCSLLGYTEHELVGRAIEEITHPDDLVRTKQYYDSVYTGRNNAIHYEKRYLRKDGRFIWGNASIAAVHDENRRVIYSIGLVQDISERVQMEEELRRANRELDSFVHTVSHDLRTPLTPIIGYAQHLQEICREKIDEQSSSYLKEIIRQGNRMMELLEDLLALARVGQLERQAEPLNVNEIVENVAQGLKCQLEAADMHVVADVLPMSRLPKSLLTQLFDNLIGNAIHYAGPGGTIEVTGSRHGARVIFSVRDHGTGIPEEERCRVFELFFRRDRAKRQNGTGLGLATVKKIAQLYNGRAWVEETPGGGCTFKVEMIDQLSP